MKRLIQFAPGLAAGLLAAGFFVLGLFGGPERFFEDILFSKKQVRGDVVIVAIDNESISEIGQWPWRRAEFGHLIDVLGDVSPKSVGIDVIFPESSQYGKADDIAFSSALERADFSIVLPVEATPLVISQGLPSAREFLETRAEFSGPSVSRGHVNLIVDPDGVVRSVPLALLRRDNGDERVVPGFSGTIVGQTFDTARVERIAYVGGPGTIPTVPFVQVLRDPAVAAGLAGKYVFVGATATDLHDEQLTPLSRGVRMSGVEIQAQIAHMLLTGDRIASIGFGPALLWLFLAAFLPTFFFILIRSTQTALFLSIVSGFVHIPAAIVFFDNGIIANILHVNIAWFLGVGAAFAFRHYVMEKDRRNIRHAFSKYVSKDVLEEILNDISKVKLGGEEKEATVFFSDVRGFTTLSEKLTPIQLTHFLNRYLTLMTDIALANRGVVDKYIGDAIMVFWGAPLSNPNHVLDAMEASLAMIEELYRFNEESVAQGDPAIDIGIGFNSGKVVAGNMGSEQRFDYTVMGDTVNLASRLEGQTKTYGAHIIASEFSIALVDQEELARRKIVIRELDRIRVKGKKQPVTIYEVVERKNSDVVLRIMGDFNAMRTAYYSGAWNDVAMFAEKILTAHDDGPTKVLMARAEQFLGEPPQDWDGVYEMKTK